MTSAYIIANVEVTNPTQYEDYKKWSSEAMKVHGAEVCPSYNYHSALWRQKFDQITYGYGFNIYGLTTNNVGKSANQ